MLTNFQALVLGLLQGLGEFLPISSSAHLALAPWLFHWPDPGLGFDVALHFGTLLAVLWYFRGEWVSLLRALGQIVTTRKIETVEQHRAAFIIVATIPGGIFGLLLEKKAETVFRSPALIAWALIVLGVILWAVDKYVERDASDHAHEMERRDLDRLRAGIRTDPGCVALGINDHRGACARDRPQRGCCVQLSVEHAHHRGGSAPQGAARPQD